MAYLAGALAPLRPLRIADVGANPIVASAYDALVRQGLAQVWGFEPHPVAAAALRDQAPENVKVIEQAIGAPGRAVFNAYPASEMSSLFKLSRRSIGYLGHFRRHLDSEEEVDVTLDSLDAVADVPMIDCLKVDAQGAELSVIEGARQKLVQAVAVVAEMRFYRLYDGEPEMHELDRALRGQGFVLHRFIAPKARMLGNSQAHRLNRRAVGSQLIDGDAVYIRNLEDRAAVSDEQLAHLALLADAMFGSRDLALWCLDELAARGALPGKVAAKYVDKLPAALKAEGAKA
ncbi:FkbM family methyltransferase [Lutimaribacter sp. EGI FJ00014]|uniref:FkbM family methyltransferase n=1 Tax=Lutimaribacter degradans TaxID=2945989 RepID=A0ACC5ZVB9_9RHOB|nr:FkbM family methyltransferase [Lutimaribacter sp. EGI FJ00013]MCM2562226.1 FkbM family methyltransferase [Lutimaribacter sp. EGI FJ00013]MCO0636355.1 FkbM family methyltransferase [Lutimaribacter sp. EGI FJ00014]